MSLCTDRTLVNEGPSEGTIATLKCKRWSCPLCLDYNRRQVVTKARDGNPTTFLTLTWNANRPETPDEAARVMKHAWVLLRRRIVKKYRVKSIPFIVVFERHKNGYPHMHILMRAPFIKQAWLSDQMRDLIDAPIVDIRAVKDRKHAFWYITKYLGKELAAFQGCKRWWRSHDYECEKDDPYKPFLFGGRFQIVDINFYTMKERVSGPGFEIVEEKRGWCHFRRRVSGGYDPSFMGTRPVAAVQRPAKRYSKLPMVGDGWGKSVK